MIKYHVTLTEDERKWWNWVFWTACHITQSGKRLKNELKPWLHKEWCMHALFLSMHTLKFVLTVGEF